MQCFSNIFFSFTLIVRNVNKNKPKKKTSITISTIGMKGFTSFQYSFFTDVGRGENIVLRQSPLFHPFQTAKLAKP